MVLLDPKGKLKLGDPTAEFRAMDADGSGRVLFEEFCVWYTHKVTPHREIARSTTKFMVPVEDRNQKAKTNSARKRLKAAFDKLEAEFHGIAADATKLKVLWARIDCNGSGSISLAEIDKAVVQKYPLLNNKPALMRAYKQTCLQDGGNGDALVDPPEFPALLINLFYFNKLYQLFNAVDTDGDHRLDIREFRQGIAMLELELSPGGAAAAFAAMDADHSGKVLFDEFCVWYTGKVFPGRTIATSTSKFLSPSKTRVTLKPKSTGYVSHKPSHPVLDKTSPARTRRSTSLSPTKHAPWGETGKPAWDNTWPREEDETAAQLQLQLNVRHEGPRQGLAIARRERARELAERRNAGVAMAAHQPRTEREADWAAEKLRRDKQRGLREERVRAGNSIRANARTERFADQRGRQERRTERTHAEKAESRRITAARHVDQTDRVNRLHKAVSTAAMITTEQLNGRT